MLFFPIKYEIIMSNLYVDFGVFHWFDLSLGNMNFFPHLYHLLLTTRSNTQKLPVMVQLDTLNINLHPALVQKYVMYAKLW